MTKLTKIDVADVEPLLKKLAEHGTAKQELSDEAARLLAKINPAPPTLVEILQKKFLQPGTSSSLAEQYGTMLDLARAQELRIKTLEAEMAVLNTSRDKQGEEIVRITEIAAKRYDALKKIKKYPANNGVWAAYDAMQLIAAKALEG